MATAATAANNVVQARRAPTGVRRAQSHKPAMLGIRNAAFETTLKKLAIPQIVRSSAKACYSDGCGIGECQEKYTVAKA